MHEAGPQTGVESINGLFFRVQRFAISGSGRAADPLFDTGTQRSPLEIIFGRAINLTISMV